MHYFFFDMWDVYREQHSNPHHALLPFSLCLELGPPLATGVVFGVASVVVVFLLLMASQLRRALHCASQLHAAYFSNARFAGGRDVTAKLHTT